jgi:hypothetical protein
MGTLNDPPRTPDGPGRSKYIAPCAPEFIWGSALVGTTPGNDSMLGVHGTGRQSSLVSPPALPRTKNIWALIVVVTVEALVAGVTPLNGGGRARFGYERMFGAKKT